MKNKFLHGAAALAFCAGVVGCSEYDQGFTPETFADVKALQYETAFVQKYGAIDPNQDWGFGSGLETRATNDTWSHDHDCTWESKLDFPQTLEDLETMYGKGNVIDLTTVKDNVNEWGNYVGKTGTVYYIPSTWTTEKGAIDAKWYVELKDGNSLYNFGTVTELTNLNFNGVVNIYNAGTFDYKITSGDINLYNTGVLNVLNTGNVYNVYNGKGGDITFGKESAADLHNKMTIYSKDGMITIPKGGDLKAACDIHGTIYADANLKIQNSETQYVCAVEVQGTLDMTQGHLETSYIKADEITFDGSEIWLLPQGHIVANTIKMYNSATYIHGYEESYGLVEAVNWYLRNQNNFTDTFSSNIYFRVNNGYIDIEERVYRDNGNGGLQLNTEYNKYDTLAEYLASQNGKELASRINKEDISATEGCVDWGKDDSTITLKESGRVFCEDLGSIGDFDFNDVVFDAYVYSDGSAKIVLWAAGGTLPITVAGFDPHAELGSGMVNTGVKEGLKKSYEFTKPAGSYTCINDIPVVVRQNDEAGEEQEILLKSVKGQAPQKIRVPLDTRWMLEYEQINDGYTLFEKWVRKEATLEETFDQNSSTTDTNYLY